MSIWILHQALTPEEENRVEEREALALPLGDVPDLSRVQSERECRLLLQTLYPEDPPETLARKTERIWALYAGIMPEDIIAVPLKARGEVALAKVSGRYRYEVGKGGSDQHLVPVEWLNRLALRVFSKHKDIFSSREPMIEVTSQDARTAIYRQLPHSYNRFVKWRWMLALFFIIGLIRLIERVMHQ